LEKEKMGGGPNRESENFSSFFGKSLDLVLTA